MRNFSKLKIDLRGHTSGHVKTFCPFCHEHRKDKHDKSLSVDIDRGLYKCHYCDAQGYVPDEDEERRKEQRREERQNQLPKNNGHVRPVWNRPSLIPLKGGSAEQQKIINYLTQERGLSIETLNAAKVTISPPSTGGAGGGSCIQFNYFDHSIFINQKSRTLDKQFRFIPKAELIPYNIDAILRKEVCYITEGEFDCLTLVQCGFAESISVPNGSQKNLTFLDRFIERISMTKLASFLPLTMIPKSSNCETSFCVA